MIEPIDDVLKDRGNTYFNIPTDQISPKIDAILFMYTTWSHSFLQLAQLLKSLKSFPDIALFIFDTDDPNTDLIKSAFDTYSDGWGETFWIKSGEIVNVKKKYDTTALNKLVENNNRLKF